MKPNNPGHSRSGAAVSAVVLASFRLNAQLLAVGDRITRRFGTTTARWTVLSELELAGRARTVPQIARALGLKRQGIQRLVDVLSEEGFTQLQPNPDHARASLVELTELGQGLLNKLNRQQARWANRMGAGLERADLSRAIKLLQRLQNRIADDNNSLKRTAARIAA
jgi:DNA-binding MarR family transcriptional regulator